MKTDINELMAVIELHRWSPEFKDLHVALDVVELFNSQINHESSVIATRLIMYRMFDVKYPLKDFRPMFN